MFGNKNLSASDSPRSIRAEDAVFIGWQSSGEGEVFPLFTITASGHPSYGSTVSDKTLRALNLQIPQTSPFKKPHPSSTGEKFLIVKKGRIAITGEKFLIVKKGRIAML